MTKKRILLVATGGTIASKEEGNGLSPALSGEELTRYVPEVADLATLDVKQAMNIDSTNMRPSDWLRVARRAQKQIPKARAPRSRGCDR